MIPEDITYSILRSVTAFCLLLFLTRIIGRKAISQMTFFDFTVAITLGSVTANLSMSSAKSAAAAATALIILSLLAIFSDYLHIQSFQARKLLQSETVVIIENGKILDQNMRRLRLTIQDLTTLLREKNVFNIADVEFALLETDGKLSVLPKSQKQPLTPSDLNIPTSYKGLNKDLIIDGQIMYENLIDAHLDEQWLRERLGQQGITGIEQVFYAGLDTAGGLYVSEKRKQKETHGKHGLE